MTQEEEKRYRETLSALVGSCLVNTNTTYFTSGPNLNSASNPNHNHNPNHNFNVQISASSLNRNRMETGNASVRKSTVTAISTIQKSLAILLHASQCEGAKVGCRHVDCFKMRRVIMHRESSSNCRRPGCPSCAQLITLCRLHAKECTKYPGVLCQVPYCDQFKKNWVRWAQHHNLLVRLLLKP